jgi:hypothetical protein
MFGAQHDNEVREKNVSNCATTRAHLDALKLRDASTLDAREDI